jgi:sulfur-carrier protein
VIKVLFFARLREELETSSLEMEWSDSTADIDSLQAALCAQDHSHWAGVLGQDNIIRAVNQQVVSDNCPINDGDEVAFFPPVTGG